MGTNFEIYIKLSMGKFFEMMMKKPIANKTLLEVYLMVLDRLKPSKSMCNVAFLLYKSGEITHSDYLRFATDILIQAQLMGIKSVYWYARNSLGLAKRVEYLNRRIAELEGENE
jgi:hypothetical protein